MKYLLLVVLLSGCGLNIPFNHFDEYQTVCSANAGCGQLWAVQELAKNNTRHFKQSTGNKILCKNVGK